MIVSQRLKYYPDCRLQVAFQRLESKLLRLPLSRLPLARRANSVFYPESSDLLAAAASAPSSQEGRSLSYCSSSLREIGSALCARSSVRLFSDTGNAQRKVMCLIHMCI